MKTTITVVAAFLSFPGLAAAQEAGTPEDERGQGIPATQHQEEATSEVASDKFRKLDQDGDGVISREEAQAESSLSENWSKYDDDGDGDLSTEEFAAARQMMDKQEDPEQVGARGETGEEMPATTHQEHAVGEDLVSQLDDNNDGRISQQEAQAEARLSDNWDQLDENDDGMLDPDELDRLEQMDIEEAE